MPKAYSYLRFSTPDQMKGDSYRRQTNQAEEYARKRGLTLDTRLRMEDLGVSAFRGRNKRDGALGAFLDAVDEGAIEPGSFLLVESLDRLSREAVLPALNVFTSIVRGGITIVTLADGKEFNEASINANPMDLMASILVMVRANEESLMKSRRLTAVWEAKRLKVKDKPLTAKIPAWLKLNRETGKIEIQEDRADVVRRMFSLYLEGVGQHTIAAKLMAEGVPVFGEGAYWHRTYVAKILANPAAIGTMIPHKIEYSDNRRRRVPLEPVEGYYPPVVERETFERAQELSRGRNSPSRGRHAKGNVSNVLGGICKCSRCGSTVTLVSKSAKWRYLVCVGAKTGQGCPYIAIPYQQVEDAFFESLSYLIGTMPSPTERGRELQDEISQLDLAESALLEARENLLTLAAKGDAPASLLERIADIEAEIEAMRAKARQLQDEFSGIGEKVLEAKMASLHDAGERRDRGKINAALRSLCKSVEFDTTAKTLTFRWSHGGESGMLFGWPEAPQMGDQCGG
jgi:DNA invertase Pin-like site-specific DNA recombinase